MSDYRFRLAGSTIRYRDGRIFVIEYVRVKIPTSFEKRGRSFKPAWKVK